MHSDISDVNFDCDFHNQYQEIFDLHFEQIKSDPRHEKVRLLQYSPIEERLFEGWSMSHRDLDIMIEKDDQLSFILPSEIPNKFKPDGEINLTVSGGTAPYNYTWQGNLLEIFNDFLTETNELDYYQNLYEFSIDDLLTIVPDDIILLGPRESYTKIIQKSKSPENCYSRVPVTRLGCKVASPSEIIKCMKFYDIDYHFPFNSFNRFKGVYHVF